ncbi:MAG: virulence-associated E family protein [Xanthobacteraceae bacterium]
MSSAALSLQSGRDHWADGLMMNKHGVPLANFRNVLHALRNAPEWHNVLAYDTFAARAITKRPPPWSDQTVAQWTDYDDNRACEWFQEHEIAAPFGMVGRGIQTVAHEHPFHPVRNYLDGLNWDGTARLDTWLITYFGVEDSQYVQAVGSRFLISAVARVFSPGCQVDHMLILEGPQGGLKSSALQAVAGSWFTDRISALGSKDSSMEVAGVWLIEMSELDALTKSTNSAIKSFVTRRHDRFRPPYGKHVVEQPRQCVFAGSINPAGGYLKDPTGARRFWPVACGHIELDVLVRDRDQLWAEALVRFKAGTVWYLETPELQALATAEQEARFEVDAWAEKIGGWLVGRNDVSVGEALVGALGVPRESWSQTAQNRVAAILAFTGFTRYRPGKAGQPRTPRYRRDAVKHHGDLRKVKLKKKSG